MSTVIYRIAIDAPGYSADDLTGKGAEITGGRWNEKGLAVNYAADTRSLACLETLVHFAKSPLPLNRFLVEIEIPDAVWSAAQRETASSMQLGWQAEPAGLVSIGFGSTWLRNRTSAVLIVPSVVVPEEFCVLINPAHPDSAGITATKVRYWLYDARLR